MSSLAAVYQNFLSNPTGAALNDEASLNYIPTLATINSSAAVVKHFANLQRVLKKKEEITLNAIESDNALCLEVDTTVEFLTGGGSYLPGLEENFLSDHTVNFPIVSALISPRAWRAANRLYTIDPHRSLRCKPKDTEHPPQLGPGVAAQAGRCNRGKSKGLANSRW